MDISLNNRSAESLAWQVDIKEIVEYNYDVMLSKPGPEHAYNNLEIENGF